MPKIAIAVRLFIVSSVSTYLDRSSFGTGVVNSSKSIGRARASNVRKPAFFPPKMRSRQSIPDRKTPHPRNNAFHPRIEQSLEALLYLLRVKTKQPAKQYRRPRQQRAQQTVDAVLDSVARLLKRGGVKAVTTNRIAEVAGVSIGSLYQYFPNKEAIYRALLERHLRQMERITESKLAGQDAGSLDERVRALVEAMVAAHAVEPELHDLLLSQVPHPADSERSARLREAFRVAIAAEPRHRTPREIDRMLFVLTNMVVALAHAAVLERPAHMSLAAATDEAVRAVLAYLHA